MTAPNAQVRIMMRERKKGRTQEQAVARANVRSRKTVAKYEQWGDLPSESVETVAAHIAPGVTGSLR